MEKSELEPGMKVRNKVSGQVGEIKGIPGEELTCAPWCVPIRKRIASGKNKGKWDYPIWRVSNLEFA